MENSYANCNIRYRNVDDIITFILGFKFLPRIGDVFQYDLLTFEVVNVQHHQVMENGLEISPGAADATLYVEIINSDKDLYKSNNS